jgi:hypothetical protein
MTIVIIVITSVIVSTGTATFIPIIKQQPQANAASLRQHSILVNNCLRSKTCRDSNVDQGTLGNDNSVTGSADQSDTAPANTSAAHNGAQGAQGAKGETGVQGAKGETGVQGAKGDTGAAGPVKSLTIRRVDTEFTFSPTQEHTVHATCSREEVLTGGGFINEDGLEIKASTPQLNDFGHSWLVLATNNDLFSSKHLTVTALCAKLS